MDDRIKNHGMQFVGTSGDAVPPPNPPPAGDNNSPPLEGVGGGKTHELKCWPDYFTALLEGKKTFEVRYDDRGYNVGDVLSLREYSPADAQYTGRVVNMRVTYIWTWRSFGFLLLSNWVVMAIIPTSNAKL